MRSGVFIFIMLWLAGQQFLSAQTGPNKLAFMEGEWQGLGWMMTQGGNQSSNILEKVECRQGCTVLVVTGLGTKTDSITKETKTVHDAFGVISYDNKAGKYMMRAYRNGEVTDAAIEFLNDKTIRWSMVTPQGGTVRFTTDFTESNKWKEMGEFSRDGNSWMKIMEMELLKK
ncbi:MAG: hypothetical protein SH818_03555 [Saprospiraceae bacterium]|nr:hypothetical protein [Saprospiraceae bacterium]